MVLEAVEIKGTPQAGLHARQRLAVVDTDIHHGFADKSDLYPYLSKTHKERLADYGIGGGGGLYSNNGGRKGGRVDLYDPAHPADSGTTATIPSRVQEHLLDPCGIDIAILTGVSVYTASSLPDVEYGSVLCRAFNDYTLEHWIGVDERFRFAMSICTQDPLGAAREIRRIGPNRKIAAVLMPCPSLRPFGHKFFHPIYEACAEQGLPIALHFGGEGSGIMPPPTAAGFPTNYIEGRQARPSFYQVHLASFIFEGIFEMHPSLKLALLEGGFGWVPSYRWRLDADWKGLRYQTPWVKKLPSEYMVEHVRFGSQPMEDPEDPEALMQIVKWMDGDRTLMFASDYPHWDFDDPGIAFQGFPPELRQRIMVDNARETFRL